MILSIAVRGHGHKKSPTSGAYVGADLHSLVADPAGPGRLFVGGHNGVAVSNDSGHSWRPVSSLDSADAMGWAFMGGTTWQGGHPGLHRSTDTRTFAQANDGLPVTDIHALGGSGSTLYAASPAAGVLASTDGGKRWELRTDQAGQSFMGQILVDPADVTHLVAPDMSAGAVESRDGGRSWRRLGGVDGAMWVTWVGGDSRRLIASGVSTAAQSTDGGANWRPLGVPEAGAIVEASPTDAAEMWAAAHNGTSAKVWVSHDGGVHWSAA